MPDGGDVHARIVRLALTSNAGHIDGVIRTKQQGEEKNKRKQLEYKPNLTGDKNKTRTDRKRYDNGGFTGFGYAGRETPCHVSHDEYNDHKERNKKIN